MSALLLSFNGVLNYCSSVHVTVDAITCSVDLVLLLLLTLRMIDDDCGKTALLYLFFL